MANQPSKNILSIGHTVAEESGAEELIRIRAYELYEARGRGDGHDVEDWLEAQAEITGRAERAAA